MRQLHDNVDANFGRANLSICYTYWRPHDFPLEAARALGLPDAEVRRAPDDDVAGNGNDLLQPAAAEAPAAAALADEDSEDDD